MTSVSKIAANRCNARLSTGPKSVGGRLRASQNARRHGLSVAISADPKLSADAKALAQKIARGNSDPNVQACAARVAEAQVDLSRIHKLRMEMFQLVMNPPSATEDSGKRSLSICDTKLLQGLARLNRYEHRATSRLKRAIRQLDICWQQSLTIDGSCIWQNEAKNNKENNASERK